MDNVEIVRDLGTFYCQWGGSIKSPHSEFRDSAEEESVGI